jgi:hypothetical protein
MQYCAIMTLSEFLYIGRVCSTELTNIERFSIHRKQYCTLTYNIEHFSIRRYAVLYSHHIEWSPIHWYAVLVLLSHNVERLSIQLKTVLCSFNIKHFPICWYAVLCSHYIMRFSTHRYAVLCSHNIELFHSLVHLLRPHQHKVLYFHKHQENSYPSVLLLSQKPNKFYLTAHSAVFSYHWGISNSPVHSIVFSQHWVVSSPPVHSTIPVLFSTINAFLSISTVYCAPTLFCQFSIHRCSEFFSFTTQHSTVTTLSDILSFCTQYSTLSV